MRNLVRLFLGIAMLIIFTQLSWAEDKTCTTSGCTYQVPLDRTGFYLAVVTLPSGQPEGVWSLVMNPGRLQPSYGGAFFAGGTLKERSQFGSWIGFSLAEGEPVKITPTNYTNTQAPLQIRLDKGISNSGRALVQDWALRTPGQTFTTQTLDPGFYVISVLSQPNAVNNTFFGLDLGAPSIYGGVVGGWLDSQPGSMGYGAFYLDSPRTMDFQLMFDGDYGTGGAGQPYLEIYYQKADGTRELKWSAPNSSPPESAPLEPIFVSQVTDPKVELGFIATTGKETMGVFGTKDSQGRLVSVNRIAFGSQTDKNQSLSITLDSNNLPATMEFPDGSKVEYSNYTNEGATATFYRPDGSVAGQALVRLSMDALHKSAEAIKKYVDSPQPTVDNFMPSTRSGTRAATNDDCVAVMTAFHGVVDNLVWGVSQIASAMACGTATTAAVATGGMAIPVAIWACGSVVLNGVDRMANAITKGHSPIKELNETNDRVQDAVSTAVSCTAREWVDCASGVAQIVEKAVINGAIEGSKPEEVCKQGTQQPATAVTPSQPATAVTPSQPATAVTPPQPATAVTPTQPATSVTPTQPSTAAVNYFIKTESHPTTARHGIENRCIVENNPPSIKGLKPGGNYSYDAEGRKHGIQIYLNGDSSFSAETYEHGVKHGPSGSWDANGKPKGVFFCCDYDKDDQWSSGVEIDVSVVTDVFFMGTYVDGIREGYSGWWKKNDCSPTMDHGMYVHDKRDGVWTYVYYDGSFHRETYASGILNGHFGSWRADGSPYDDEGNYVNGKKDGVWTFYSECGDGIIIKSSIQTYVNGVVQGSSYNSCPIK